MLFKFQSACISLVSAAEQSVHHTECPYTLQNTTQLVMSHHQLNIVSDHQHWDQSDYQSSGVGRKLQEAAAAVVTV